MHSPRRLCAASRLWLRSQDSVCKSCQGDEGTIESDRRRTHWHRSSGNSCTVELSSCIALQSRENVSCLDSSSRSSLPDLNHPGDVRHATCLTCRLRSCHVLPGHCMPSHLPDHEPTQPWSALHVAVHEPSYLNSRIPPVARCIRFEREPPPGRAQSPSTGTLCPLP